MTRTVGKFVFLIGPKGGRIQCTRITYIKISVGSTINRDQRQGYIHKQNSSCIARREVLGEEVEIKKTCHVNASMNGGGRRQ